MPVFADKGYIHIENISHNISSGGKLLYRLNAKKGYIKNFSSNDFFMDKVEVLWFQDKKKSLKIKAEKGIMNKKNGNVTLNGNIEAVSEKYKIYCNKIRYDNLKKIIFFYEDLKIISDSSKIKSSEGNYDILTGAVTLIKNVEGYIK